MKSHECSLFKWKQKTNAPFLVHWTWLVISTKTFFNYMNASFIWALNTSMRLKICSSFEEDYLLCYCDYILKQFICDFICYCTRNNQKATESVSICLREINGNNYLKCFFIFKIPKMTNRMQCAELVSSSATILLREFRRDEFKILDRSRRTKRTLCN